MNMQKSKNLQETLPNQLHIRRNKSNPNTLLPNFCGIPQDENEWNEIEKKWQS